MDSMRAYRAVYGADELADVYDEVMHPGGPIANNPWGQADDIGARSYAPLQELAAQYSNTPYGDLIPGRIIVFQGSPPVNRPDQEHQRQRNLSLFRNARVLGTLTAADQNQNYVSDRLELHVDRDNARKDIFPTDYPSIMAHKFLTEGSVNDVELSPARGLSETREDTRVFFSPEAAVETAKRWLAHVTETEDV